MIYLDNAATTKIDPFVLDAMMPYLQEQYGNPGSKYQLGRQAAEAVAYAREQVVGLFDCRPEQIIFTSSGSEANNMVFKGLRSALVAADTPHILVSATEHDSVLKAVQALTWEGLYYSPILPTPDNRGMITKEDVERELNPGSTSLVSVMYVNNETGVVNDVSRIGAYCQEQGAFFHMDCVQAAGVYPLQDVKNYADFATVSAHKIHGPKGVGALFARDPEMLTPLIDGGTNQEFGFRGGTENVAGIVGFGAAAELAESLRAQNAAKLSSFRRVFLMTLRNVIASKRISPDIIHVNGQPGAISDKVLSLTIDGVDAETLLLYLDGRGVCMSAGSACTAHEQKPSHVLLAMGLTEEQARSTIRASFSGENTTKEVLEAAKICAECIVSLLQVDA